MKLNSQVKPSKSTSLMGAIVGFFMMIFGIVFFATVSQESTFDDGGQIISAFFILFILTALCITVFYAWNFFSDKGVSVFDVNIESDSTTAPPPADDAATRLRQLDKLKSEGLINDEEYTRKREDILKGL